MSAVRITVKVVSHGNTIVTRLRALPDNCEIPILQYAQTERHVSFNPAKERAFKSITLWLDGRFQEIAIQLSEMPHRVWVERCEVLYTEE